MRINELLRTSKKSVPFPKNQTRHASHLFLKVSKDFQVRGKRVWTDRAFEDVGSRR